MLFIVVFLLQISQQQQKHRRRQGRRQRRPAYFTTSRTLLGGFTPVRCFGRVRCRFTLLSTKTTLRSGVFWCGQCLHRAAACRYVLVYIYCPMVEVKRNIWAPDRLSANIVVCVLCVRGTVPKETNFSNVLLIREIEPACKRHFYRFASKLVATHQHVPGGFQTVAWGHILCFARMKL